MRDVVLLVPIFVTGAFMLVGLSESSRRPSDYFIAYLLSLAILFGLLYSWWRVKLKSAERLRALELGHPAGAPDAGWTLGRACAAIGLGVPVGVFVIAWLATLSAHSETSAIWTAAAAVGVTVTLCATFMLSRLPASAFHAQGPYPGAPNNFHAPKPEAYDPDAFDVAGRRG